MLKNIFDYYKENANLNVAKKLVLGITNETLKLILNPTMGQKEEALTDDNKQFRYLIF